MNKKILVIGILGMFLLLSFVPFSTVGQKVETTEQTQTTGEDLPDLTVEIIEITHPTWQYEMLIEISNEGTATIIFEETPVVYKVVYKGQDVLWGARVSGESLKPGDVYSTTVPFFFFELDAGEEITIVMDPTEIPDRIIDAFDLEQPDPEYGLIQELNEDNNIDTEVVPKARLRDSFRPLFSLLSKFPLFQRILEKLAFF